jgi:hypothetical protein
MVALPMWFRAGRRGPPHLVAVPGASVTDVVIAEPPDHATDLRGSSSSVRAVADPTAAVQLLERAGAAGAAGVVLRRGPARARGVRAAARRSVLRSWNWTTRRRWSISSEWSRTSWTGPSRRTSPRSDPGGEADLLGLADAAAALVDAPVTIEDAHSRVLAYSSRHDVTDPARVSTVLGRRVPPPSWLSALTRSVPAAGSLGPVIPRPPGQGLERPRYVVPVRAAGEWLGPSGRWTNAVPGQSSPSSGVRPPSSPCTSFATGRSPTSPDACPPSASVRCFAVDRSTSRLSHGCHSGRGGRRPGADRTGGDRQRRRGRPRRVGVTVPARGLAATADGRRRRPCVRAGRHTTPAGRAPQPGRGPGCSAWRSPATTLRSGPGWRPESRRRSPVTSRRRHEPPDRSRASAVTDPALGTAPTAEEHWAG